MLSPSHIMAAGSWLKAHLLGHVPAELVKVHDFEPCQDPHVDEGDKYLERGDHVGVGEVVV